MTRRLTREEAIQTLKWFGMNDKQIEVVVKAFQIEPCEDAIRRQAVLNTLDRMDKALDVDRTVENYKALLKECFKNLTSVQLEAKTGHWVRITNGAVREKYICSECGRQIEDCGVEGLLPVKYPYCHCGAKMEVEE